MKDWYYWVKFLGVWSISKVFANGKRFVCGNSGFSYWITELDEIGDYIETPDKYKAELEAGK